MSLQELKTIYKRIFASPFLLYISEFRDLFSAAILKWKFNLYVQMEAENLVYSLQNYVDCGGFFVPMAPLQYSKQIECKAFAAE